MRCEQRLASANQNGWRRKAKDVPVGARGDDALVMGRRLVDGVTLHARRSEGVVTAHAFF